MCWFFAPSPSPSDLEVTGTVVVKLWITSTAPDTDFTAKLIDEIPPNADYPLGFDLNLGDSIFRARYREGARPPGPPLNPGDVAPITITLYPNANVFKKGHRIRVDISSSNYPRFDVNPNTGDPLGEYRRMVGADNTVHHDAAHPSQVIFPVIPGRTSPRLPPAGPRNLPPSTRKHVPVTKSVPSSRYRMRRLTSVDEPKRRNGVCSSTACLSASVKSGGGWSHSRARSVATGICGASSLASARSLWRAPLGHQIGKIVLVRASVAQSPMITILPLILSSPGWVSMTLADARDV